MMQELTPVTKLGSAIDRAETYWNRIVNDQEAASYRVALSILIVILLTAAALLIWTGPVPQNIYGHDTPLLYDGAWRIMQGQIPYVDFHSALGPLSYMVIAWGMKISSVSANAISYGIAIILVPALVLAWISAYRKTSVLYAFLFCLFILFLLIGTHYPGSSYWETTYSTYYNRVASAFFFIFLLEIFLPDRPELPLGAQRRSNQISGIITGICLATLFWIKISFFLVAGGALVLSFLLRWDDKLIRWLAYIVLGGLVIMIPMALYLGSGMVNYVQDIQLAAASRLSSPRFMALKMLIAFLANYLHIAWIGYIVWMWRTNPVISRPRLAIILAFFLAASLVIFSTNSNVPGPEKELPTLAMPTFVALEYLRRKNNLAENDHARASRFGWWSVAQIGLIFAMTFVFRDIASFVYASNWHFTTRPHIPQSYRFNSKTLYELVSTTDFPLYNKDVANRFYTELVNDGLSLLSSNTDSTDRVTVLDLTNPFSFGLMLPSPQGDAVWWNLNFTFSKKAHIPASRIFRTTTKIMVNRYSAESDAIMQVYGSYVHQNYALEAQSKYWDLYTLR